jgi:hypothetical protein
VLGYLVSILSCLLAPESQGCLVIHFSYLYFSFLVLMKYMTGIKHFYEDGPLIPSLFDFVEKILPKCVTAHYGFCSIQEYYKSQERLREQERREAELAEESELRA